jgi:hypothetical protein
MTKKTANNVLFFLNNFSLRIGSIVLGVFAIICKKKLLQAAYHNLLSDNSE